MLNLWKLPQIAKGLLTQVPALDRLRIRRARMGATRTAAYCFRVWHSRHLTALERHGFTVQGAAIAELGPGDSIGTGLAALLCGAGLYVGIDVVAPQALVDLGAMLETLVRFHAEAGLALVNVRRIREALDQDTKGNRMIRHLTSWEDAGAIAQNSLDLIFSQSVLEYADLQTIYPTMLGWLRPGGYTSHYIDFRSHRLSPHWNGHWAFSEAQWRLCRGRRDVFLNRAPLSAHVSFARQAGFEVLLCQRDAAPPGLDASQLAPPFRALSHEDLTTSGAFLILHKPDVDRFA